MKVCKSPKKTQCRESAYRRQVAELALRVRSGRLSFFDFLDQIKMDQNTSGDDEIDRLINLLEHLPDKRDMLGVGTEKINSPMQKIEDLINKLAQSTG